MSRGPDPFSLESAPDRALQVNGPRARIVIVHGPKASGKTRNAEALRALLGADRIVDDWDGRAPLRDGDLALTNCDIFHGRRGTRVVSIKTALALLAIGDRNP